MSRAVAKARALMGGAKPGDTRFGVESMQGIEHSAAPGTPPGQQRGSRHVSPHCKLCYSTMLAGLCQNFCGKPLRLGSGNGGGAVCRAQVTDLIPHHPAGCRGGRVPCRFIESNEQGVECCVF